MDYLLEAKAKQMAIDKFEKKLRTDRKVMSNSRKVTKALSDKRNIGFTAGAAVAGGASAAVLWSTYQKYKKAAEEAKSPRDRRIYLAKADRYKKLAIAAGATGAGAAAAHAATYGGAKAAGAIAKSHGKNLIDKVRSGRIRLKESYADGYYAALKDLDVLEEAYDEYDYYDEY